MSFVLSAIPRSVSIANGVNVTIPGCIPGLGNYSSDMSSLYCRNSSHRFGVRCVSRCPVFLSAASRPFRPALLSLRLQGQSTLRDQVICHLLNDK